MRKLALAVWYVLAFLAASEVVQHLPAKSTGETKTIAMLVVLAIAALIHHLYARSRRKDTTTQEQPSGWRRAPRTDRYEQGW